MYLQILIVHNRMARVDYVETEVRHLIILVNATK